ncbi:hypothetical protein F0U61_42040 [Archangium violaceum]|uniref:hypothetical protein n=1 Tax=Archangium violaceum TaxID=83451 RepID=UPI002B2EF08B|nr:hypothetical protein F0U61_42040 [Archangium violaceum]
MWNSVWGWRRAVILATLGLGCTGTSTRPTPHPTSVTRSGEAAPLIRIDKVTEVEGDIGEGGFDYRIAGGSFLAARLHPCGTGVSEATNTWADTHRLPVLRREVASERVLMHLGSKAPPGFFELLYRFEAAPQSARVILTFHDLKGNPIEPALGEFDSLRLSDLSRSLKTALECTPSH